MRGIFIGSKKSAHCQHKRRLYIMTQEMRKGTCVAKIPAGRKTLRSDFTPDMVLSEDIFQENEKVREKDDIDRRGGPSGH